ERVLKQLYASGLAVLFLLGVPTSALNDPNQFVVGCIAGRPRTSGILETEKIGQTTRLWEIIPT
ncbi:hypothetical protein, partial [uncultured Lacticaseibacillus sp.]